MRSYTNISCLSISFITINNDSFLGSFINLVWIADFVIIVYLFLKMAQNMFQ